MFFVKLFMSVWCSKPNPPLKHNGLWVILAIRVCTVPHFDNRTEIVDHSGTFGILYYALGHTYKLTYYLVCIVCTLGCMVWLSDPKNHEKWEECVPKLNCSAKQTSVQKSVYIYFIRKCWFIKSRATETVNDVILSCPRHWQRFYCSLRPHFIWLLQKLP